MDRRVFQPPPTNSAAHRRSAIRMALAVLLAGLLALHYLHSSAPPVVAPSTAAPATPGARP